MQRKHANAPTYQEGYAQQQDFQGPAAHQHATKPVPVNITQSPKAAPVEMQVILDRKDKEVAYAVDQRQGDYKSENFTKKPDLRVERKRAAQNIPNATVTTTKTPELTAASKPLNTT